ncbi:hypothetical protein XELAEV_18037974mg [Xenopus laevis]|uniref:Kelch domain-containing protein 7A n=1 Tax=Xenopus laevis TaxID=8355 RepID=A0A974CD62_XENLA|nr:hypothetical protein XELAEV_18037974mg [Xenopus laevis]
MQLVGKLTLSATAAFILALAFRFYKSRVHERRGVDNGSGRSGNLDVGEAAGGHVNDETNELRCRRRKRTQHSDVISAAGSQSLAGDPVTAQEFNSKSQGGAISEYQSADGISTHQSGLNNETPETRAVASTDPKYHQKSLGNGNGVGTIGDNSDSGTVQSLKNTHKDIIGIIVGIIKDNPESGTVQPPKDSGKYVSEPNGIGTIGDNLDSGTVQPLKDSGKDISEPNGIGTIRDNLDSGTLQPIKDISEPYGIGTIRDNLDFGTIQPPEDSGKDISDPNGIGTIANGSSPFHVSLSPDSTFDIHLGLENCFEVLSLAKKHNLDALKTAAYKVMSDNYLDVLQNPSVYRHLHAAERDLILERRMRGRRYIVVADIDTMGHSVSENSSLSYYDSDQDSWHLLSSMPPEAVSRACSMATMFNYVFIVLGCQGLERDMKPSKRVVCYNPVTDKWQDICPLNEARPHCKLVELDGYLYAIGGECLHTVERYDPWQNRWSYVAPLPNDTFAVAHMATAYDDEIYVTGGTIRYMLLRYLRKDNTWKSSIITGSKDRTTDLVAANNFLYRFDMNRSMGISVHRCSVRARIWYECATYTMPHPLPFQCAVIDNNIYCISRNFHLRFLTNDISPRFMEDNLKTLPCPKGLLSPLVLVLPGLDSQ